MKKLILSMIVLCLSLLNIQAEEKNDPFNQAYMEYIEDPYMRIPWVEKEPDSVYDLSLKYDYTTSNEKRIFLGLPQIMMVAPSITDYKIGNEVFTFNNSGYAPFFLVYSEGKMYQIEEAYEKKVINDWDLREYSLAKNFRVKSYPDLNKNEWYYMMVEKSIFNGFMKDSGKFNDNGQLCFEPDSNITRGMVATVLYRMSQNPTVNFNSKFTDVKAGLWYSNAISWAVDNNIISGKNENTFEPDEPITRQDLAIMLRNYAKSQAMDTNKVADISMFMDDEMVDEYAESAIAWCVEEGIISGTLKQGKLILIRKQMLLEQSVQKCFVYYMM